MLIEDAVPELRRFTQPIWEQQRGESQLWYGRFLAYCQITPRTVLALYRKHVYETHGRTPKWMSPSWEKAAVEYINREKIEEWERRKAEIIEREYQLGSKSLQLAGVVMEALTGSPDFLDTANTKDFERLVLTGSKMTRIASGMVTNREEVALTGEIANMPVLIARRLIEDPDAVARANELLERAANRDTSGNGLDS